MTRALLALSLLLPVVSHSIELARDGRAEAVIVAAATAPAPVRFAAAELKQFLDRMSGGDFCIVEAAPATGPAIVLGEAPAAAAGLELGELTRDGYVFATRGNRLYVFGKDSTEPAADVLFTVYDGPFDVKAPKIERDRAYGYLAWQFERGTLHGAYALLEELGCRWYFPGPLGEVVPKAPTMVLPALDRRDEPHYWFRWNGGVEWPSPRRLGQEAIDPEEYARLEWNCRLQRLWLVRMRVSSQWLGFSHRPGLTAWRERFAETHPEYFALLPDGSRADGTAPGLKREYLNYTSEGVVEETVEDVCAYFAGERPETRGIPKSSDLNNGWNYAVACGDFFSLLPNDGLRVDHSPESRQYIREDAPLPERHTNYIWQFVDKVARRVQPRFPDKYLVCLAYQAYWEVPTVIDKLPDNVVVGIAALSGPSLIGRSLRPADYAYGLDLCRRWDAMSAAPLLYWHYWLPRGEKSFVDLPLQAPRHAGRWLRDIAPYGRWMFMQHDFRRITMEHLNRYVIHRCMWDPNTDVDALLADYFASFYGPAAADLAAIFGDMEERCVASAAASADYLAIWERYFTAEVLADYRQRLDHAAAIAAGTEYAPRVALVDDFWIGVMEAGRERYVKDVRDLIAKGADRLKAATWHDPIVIDGNLNEKTWHQAPRNGMYNNQDGRKVEPTNVRALVHDNTLYVAWHSTGEYLGGAEPPPRTTVELFIQPNPGSPEFYQVWLPLDAEPRSWVFPEVGEPGDPDWQSGIDYAVCIQPGSWSVEIALPLATIARDRPADADEWRVNFCRTILSGVDRRNFFATVNPIHRGGFAQPSLFARLPGS